MTDRPISRCAVKGCPFIGHWPEGERCPQHRDTTTRMTDERMHD